MSEFNLRKCNKCGAMVEVVKDCKCEKLWDKMLWRGYD